MVQSARHNLETTSPYDYRPCPIQTVHSELVVVAEVTTAIQSALVTGNERLECTSAANRPTPILTWHQSQAHQSRLIRMHTVACQLRPQYTCRSKSD